MELIMQKYTYKTECLVTWGHAEDLVKDIQAVLDSYSSKGWKLLSHQAPKEPNEGRTHILIFETSAN